MASSSGKRTSSSGRTRKSTTSSRSRQVQRSAQDSELFHEIGLIVLFVAMLILFCCNFGIIGPVGNAISGVLFGIFRIHCIYCTYCDISGGGFLVRQ